MIINNLLRINFICISEVAFFRVKLKRFLKSKNIQFKINETTDLLLGKAIVNGYVY